MKKKIINGILMVALLFAATTSFVSCKDNVDDEITAVYANLAKQKTTLEEQLSALQNQLNGLGDNSAEITKINDEIRKINEQLGKINEQISTLSGNVDTIKNDLAALTKRVEDLEKAIKDAGGKEYSKSEVKDGAYVPVKGDIIIFKSNGASHVGIVDYTSDGRIYYIDGNNTTYGKGNNSCVHYSDCSVSKKTFTCVLRPDYR